MQNILLIHPLSSSSSPPLSSSSSSKEPTVVRFYIAVFCSSSYCSCCFCTSFSIFILSHNVCQNVSHTHTYYILHCIAYQHVQQPKCYIRPYKQTERHSLNHTHTHSFDLGNSSNICNVPSPKGLTTRIVKKQRDYVCLRV